MIKAEKGLVEKLQDCANLLHRDGYEDAPVLDGIALIVAMSKDIEAMHADLSYLNKMCLALMSLLPESVTPADIKAAVQRHGAEVREAKKGIITDV